jgi:CMP-N,N'-diacetyllegionaminic acid synthase
MYNNKKLLVVVPARGGSKGVKLKNIRPLNGIPLVGLVGKVTIELSYIDRAIVSTDHPEIAKTAMEYGLDVPFIRPENLSGDLVPDLDVLTHALLAMEELDNVKYDIIIMLQPTSPSRKPYHVRETIEKLINGNYDAVWTISETDSKGHPLKQLTFNDNKLDYYDQKGSQIIARQQLTPVYHKNGVAYAITRECLIDKKSIKGDRTSAVIIKEMVVNIDTEFDFKLAEFLMKNIFE